MSLVAEKLIESYVASARTPFIPLNDACEFLGISPKSARSMICRNRFPVPATKRGPNWCVLADVLIAYYRDKLKEATGATPPKSADASAPRKRRGAPTKRERKEQEEQHKLQLRLAEQVSVQ